MGSGNLWGTTKLGGEDIQSLGNQVFEKVHGLAWLNQLHHPASSSLNIHGGLGLSNMSAMYCKPYVSHLSQQLTFKDSCARFLSEKKLKCQDEAWTLAVKSTPEQVVKLSMQSLTPSPTMPTLWKGRNELGIFSSMLRKADTSLLQNFYGCASKAHSSRSVFHCWSPWQRLQFPRAHMPNLWPQTKHRGLHGVSEREWSGCLSWLVCSEFNTEDVVARKDQKYNDL